LCQNHLLENQTKTEKNIPEPRRLPGVGFRAARFIGSGSGLNAGGERLGGLPRNSRRAAHNHNGALRKVATRQLQDVGRAGLHYRYA